MAAHTMTDAHEQPAARVVLADIEPGMVAMAMAFAMLGRMRFESARLGPGLRLSVDVARESAEQPPTPGELERALLGSQVFRDAYALARWAKTGTGPAALADVAALLATVTKDVRGFSAELVRGAPSNAVEVILVAARARLLLAMDQPVTAIELATLASVDDRTIRGYVSAGHLVPLDKRRPMRFAAETARAELGLRGVPGFPPVESSSAPR